MHLKSIEMVGFKSFADKTAVDLKDGISAIVGPNGCGKSNIVDAIRWCLGEMSPRSLRSKQMLDVIFAGASGRAALNLSEVTLTFDNSHHLLPIDYTEVQVTRRLFRSGESEYHLNKTQCRLKDIRDLFMDTGLAEGYSIMAQGEVDFVMNAKPDQRRELFEEAAGILKYKLRREESLRKLERVQIDMNRLNDIITLTKEQMDSLESAARKAKSFQKMREELKTLEIIDSLNQIAKLDEEVQIKQKRADELKEQIRHNQVNFDCAEAEWTKKRVEQDEYDKQLYQSNSHLAELEIETNASDNALKTAQEREQEFIEKEKKCAEQIRQSREEFTILEEKLQKAQGEIDSTQEIINQLKAAFEKENGKWLSLQKERKEMDAVKNRLSENLFHAAGEINQAENEKNSGSSLFIRKEQEIISLKKEFEKGLQEQNKLNGEIAVLEDSLRKLEQSRSENEAQTQTLREQFIAGEKALNEAAAHSHDLHRAIIQKESQLGFINQAIESNPYRKGTQAVLKQGFPGMKGVIALLFKYSENMGQWVESILGQKMNYLVFEHLGDAQNALHWLKENRLGRATCIILDKIPSVNPPDISSIPNANSMLSFVQCDPELENLKRYLFGAAFIAGDTLYDSNTIDGGSDIAPVEQHGNESSEAGEKTNGQDSSPSQNQFLLKGKLEEEIRIGEGEREALEKKLSELQLNLSTIKTAIAGKEKVAGQVQVEENHSRHVLSEKKESAEICTREIALFKEGIAKDEQELTELSSAIERADQKLKELVEKRRQSELEREDIQKKLEMKLSEEHSSALIVNENKVRQESTFENLQKSRDLFNDWHTRVGQSKKFVEETTGEIENCKAKVHELSNIQKTETAKIEKLESKKAETSKQVEELLSKKSEWEQQNRDMEANIQKLRENQSQMSTMLHEIEFDLRTFENDKGSILKRLDENYQMTPEQAREQFTPKPIEPEELLKLRKRIDSLSNSVNLEAPEQYQQLQERYNFLSTQMQDLTKAKEDLQKVIQQINITTKEHFKETFTKVRDNFRAIFSTLFSGGEADLVFTDEQNLLETGIDIVAQPAGKKLQNIALLSGGEKALTAIALLFAFFMVKPSPFCVLDEVDAPWDPANVDRFLKLLKEFSQKTQFLIVTHNTRTMEIADILYGVTMQEFGISKILSTRLKKATAESAAALVPA